MERDGSSHLTATVECHWSMQEQASVLDGRLRGTDKAVLAITKYGRILPSIDPLSSMLRRKQTAPPKSSPHSVVVIAAGAVGG
jgi:hypothetical protein